MFRKSKQLLLVAATFSCSLFLFMCTPDSKENTQEEEQELEQVYDMLERDKAKMDSIKNELLQEDK